MNFKTPFKVLTTAALIGTLSLSAVAPGAASAATPAVSAQEAEAATAVEKILFEKDGKQYEINLEEYLILVATQATLVEDSTPISVVSPTTGKFYDLEEFLLTQALNEEDTAKAFELLDADETKAQDFKPFTVELDENGAPIVKDPTETPDSDFKVTEIAAITQTLPAKKDQAISFTVNGDKTVTAADLIKEGYTVSFKFNKALTGLTADEQKAAKEEGIVNATKAPFNTDFTYAVEVTDEDGNKIGDATDFKKVSVKSADTAVSVEGVKLVEGTDTVDYVTVGQENVKFEGTVAKNAFGEELKTVPQVKSVKALTPTVAYYEGGAIVAEEEGTAKFEVTFEGIETPVTTEVTVKAEAKAASVKETSVKVAKGQDVELTILDQHGKEITANTGLKYTIAADGAQPVEKTTTASTLTIPAFNTAGKYTVTITGAEDKVLGTVEVTVLDDSKAVATSYEVTEDEKTHVLGLTVGSTEVTTKGYKVTGIADGLKLANLESTVASLRETVGEGELKVETSDKTVATAAFDGKATNGEINVTAVKKGTATISLVYVAGDAKKELTKFDVTVKNDTPQYTQENLSLKANTTAIAIAKDQNLDDAIEAGLVYDEKAIAAGSVDASSVKVVNQELQADGTVTGDVVFSTTTAFGAKKLTFPAVYAADTTVAQDLQIEAVKAGKATAAQYKALAGVETAPTADQVKVLNSLFSNTVFAATTENNAYVDVATPAAAKATKATVTTAVTNIANATEGTQVNGNVSFPNTEATWEAVTFELTDGTKETILPDTYAALIAADGKVVKITDDSNGDLHIKKTAAAKTYYALKIDGTTWTKFTVTGSEAQ